MTDNVKDNLTVSAPDGLSLGKQVEYEFHYNPDLLQGVPRSLSRDTLSLNPLNLPFSGNDTWTGYELSWLTPKGKPQVAILECRVPITSPNLIESKSFKLYLNSFNQSKFENANAVKDVIQSDLSACAGSEVDVALVLPSQFASLSFKEFEGELLDDLDVEINEYSPNTAFLSQSDKNVEESLSGEVFRDRVAHFDLVSVKPLDFDMLNMIFKNFEKVITVEDGVIKGGVGEAIQAHSVDQKYRGFIRVLGIPDRFPQHGTVQELQDWAGISSEKIKQEIRALLL